jgi:signal transduction histidine kinase
MESDERRRLYREGMEQCERVTDIVKNLLEFSRASHPRLEQVSLQEIVRKTAQLMANEMKLNDVRFSEVVQDQLPDLQVDKGGLQQVLLNLFLNSIQAMPNGGELTVVIRLSKAKNEGVIEVKDTGAGIPPDQISRIFDPFYTTKKNGEGTGLGLSVSYSIIEKHGGRIEVQSQPGEGTTFSIFLPFDRPPF